MNDCTKIPLQKFEFDSPNVIEIMEDYKNKTVVLLKNARTPEDHYRVLHAVYEEHARLFDAIPLACKKGCSYCCHLKVDAKAHEIVFFIEYLQRTCRKETLTEIALRAKEHSARIFPMDILEQLGSNNRCPALIDDKCIGYQARPFSCRNFHAQNLDTCIYSYNNPTVFGCYGSEHELLKVSSGAAWIGCSSAYADAGYDSNIYDFGSALSEAFQNPKCAKRWRDKKNAFSKACLAKG